MSERVATEETETPLVQTYYTFRERCYHLFAPHDGGRVGHVVDWAIMALIATNVIAVMLETVDPLATTYAPVFYWFERVSVAVFTLEYLGRVWSVVETPEYDGIISGRVAFASRPLLLIDLLAILPFYLMAAGIGADLRFIRSFRLVRGLRLLKLARYSNSLMAFSAVLRRKKTDLVIAGVADIVLLIVASSLMYHIEHEAQPEAFSSIPATLWWGVVTLTTVGYGDVYPITPLGKIFGALTAVLGIGLFALPASILASGFIEEARDQTHECPHCGEEIDEDVL